MNNHILQEIARVLAGFGPVTFQLGKIGVFPAGPGRDYDVLYVEVTSPDLHKMRRVLEQVPHEKTFPSYQPHVTLAYLKPGRGKQYADALEPLNLTVTADTVTFSDLKGQKRFIYLKPGVNPTPQRGRGVK